MCVCVRVSLSVSPLFFRTIHSRALSPARALISKFTDTNRTRERIFNPAPRVPPFFISRLSVTTFSFRDFSFFLPFFLFMHIYIYDTTLVVAVSLSFSIFAEFTLMDFFSSPYRYISTLLSLLLQHSPAPDTARLYVRIYIYIL